MPWIQPNNVFAASRFTGNMTLDDDLVFNTANPITITATNPAASRILTIPAIGQASTFAFLQEAQTFSAAQTFNTGAELPAIFRFDDSTVTTAGTASAAGRSINVQNSNNTATNAIVLQFTTVNDVAAATAAAQIRTRFVSRQTNQVTTQMEFFVNKGSGSGFTALNRILMLDTTNGWVSFANLGISTPNIAGVANAFPFAMPITAGGAANAVLKWNFQFDGTDEAGLLGETDGSGGYTQAKTIWKVPYRDSGANVAAPTAPTTAATWLGGVRVEAGDDANRIYFYANEAWHYINQTAGFEIPTNEQFCLQCNELINAGERVVGRVDKIIGDGARHGLWEHEICPN